MKDFYFMGDDYRYHIEVEAKRKLLELLKSKFDAGARYKGKTWKWDTIILDKTHELARFLYWKTKDLNFVEPPPSLRRIDTIELRKRISSLSVKGARRLGFSKSTVHYLRLNAMSSRSLQIYSKTRRKLEYAVRST